MGRGKPLLNIFCYNIVCVIYNWILPYMEWSIVGGHDNMTNGRQGEVGLVFHFSNGPKEQQHQNDGDHPLLFHRKL